MIDVKTLAALFGAIAGPARIGNRPDTSLGATLGIGVKSERAGR
jgi:hypothetical protein